MKKVKLLPPTSDTCEECDATADFPGLDLWDIPCDKFPGYEDLRGTVTLCLDCLEYEGHPEYEFPE